MRLPSSLLLPAGLICLLAFTAANAGDDSYLRGYAQALLDEHYAQLGLEVRQTRREATVAISGERCIDAAQRHAIRQRLTASGPIVAVRWDLACPIAGTSTAPAAATGLTWLPTTDIFRPLQADPREPQLALALQRYDTRGRHFTVGDVSAGETFNLLEGGYGGGSWQIGIQGGVFSVFDMDTHSNDLLNTDYLVGLPVTFRQGPWSARARLYHMSSHLGDEYILHNNINQRLNISYEAVDAVLSRQWRRWRLYGGGGYKLRTTEGLDRGMLQAGAEWRDNDVFGNIDLALGADLKASGAQDWTVNQSYQGALIFTREQREIRFFLEYYTGRSPNGQFLLDRLNYFGAGIQFGI